MTLFVLKAFVFTVFVWVISVLIEDMLGENDK